MVMWSYFICYACWWYTHTFLIYWNVHLSSVVHAYVCIAFPFELPVEADERFRYIYSGNIRSLLGIWKKELPADAIGNILHIPRLFHAKH
jgi:hypothetical protein